MTREEQQPCNDCISRADAKKYLSAPDTNGDRVIYESDLDLLPSVTPQQKKGHWIVEVWNNREHHTCSVCQMVVNYEPCYHYCPYCGAEMEVENEN